MANVGGKGRKKRNGFDHKPRACWPAIFRPFRPAARASHSLDVYCVSEMILRTVSGELGAVECASRGAEEVALKRHSIEGRRPRRRFTLATPFIAER